MNIYDYVKAIDPTLVIILPAPRYGYPKGDERCRPPMEARRRSRPRTNQFTRSREHRLMWRK